MAHLVQCVEGFPAQLEVEPLVQAERSLQRDVRGLHPWSIQAAIRASNNGKALGENSSLVAAATAAIPQNFSLLRR